MLLVPYPTELWNHRTRAQSDEDHGRRLLGLKLDHAQQLTDTCARALRAMSRLGFR